MGIYAVPVVRPFATRTSLRNVYSWPTMLIRARIINANNNVCDIDSLPGPAVSPDLNYIEHMWDLMTKRRDTMNPQVFTLWDLKSTIWDDMKRRCDQLVANNDQRFLILTVPWTAPFAAFDRSVQSHRLSIDKNDAF